VSEHTSTPKTFDDYLRAAQAKDAASMAELASLFALEKSECVAALVQIARGRTDCGRPLGGEVSRQIARKSLVKIGVDFHGI
jgi:hypothetical protein